MLPILPKIDTVTQEKKFTTPIAPIKHRQTKSSTNSTFPKLLFFAGIILLLTQIIPLGISFFTGIVLGSQSRGFVPVSAAFIEQLSAVKYIDPTAEYLTAVIAETQSTVINTAYSKAMRLSLPSSKITNINLVPNIPGNDAPAYDAALKKGVAHLKGTALPGDMGTSVIYGHSGVSGFLTSKSNPMIIFSRLDTVSIGDTMTVIRDGKELQYVVSSKKIVDPNDFSFIESQDGKERAVLITCWPLGIGTKRLIVITDRIQ